MTETKPDAAANVSDRYQAFRASIEPELAAKRPPEILIGLNRGNEAEPIRGRPRGDKSHKKLTSALRCLCVLLFACFVLPLVGQPFPAPQPAMVRTNWHSTPSAEFNNRVDYWQTHGHWRAQFVWTNYVTNVFTRQQSPRAGGAQKVVSTSVMLVTNAARPLPEPVADDGSPLVFVQIVPPRPFIYFVDTNGAALLSSTNLTDWSPVGYDCAREPKRFWSGAGPFYLVRTNL